jgi:tRNA (adenine57-N1/adenine58-N1)-methyltransferase catalytic subunit
MKIKKKALINKNNEIFLYNDNDIHTKYGVLKKEIIDKSKIGNNIKTNKNIDFYLINANELDLYRKIKRLPQLMLPKDIMSIIAYTGINKNSIVIDAGGGSGGFSIMTAMIAKKVYSYEIKEEHAKLIEENSKMIGIKNLIVRRQNIYEKVIDKNADVFILDLAEPWNAVDNALKTLKIGGFIVNYSPNLTQTKKFIQKIKDTNKCIYIKTIENIQREWEIDELRLRPMFNMLGHTAFLSFARKIS